MGPIDRRPPEWDHANHLERAISLLSKSTGSSAALGMREILEASSFYTPLVTHARRAPSLSSSRSPRSPLSCVAMGFLGLALVCLYGLRRRLADAETGLWAALFLGTAPFVVFSLTNFQFDLPLPAMVALALYALLRTQEFSEFSVVAGARCHPPGSVC